MSWPLMNSAEPTTRMSTPRPPTNSAVSRLTPPSTWTSPPNDLWLSRSRAASSFSRGDVLHELLATEAGLDGHDHHDVEQLAVGLERRQRRRRLERQPGGPTGGPDLSQGRRDLLLDLDVEGDRVAAGVEVLVDVAARLADHQVGVERQLRPRPQMLDRLRAERQVRDEVAVHDVEVDPVGAGLLDPPDGVGEVREVGVEDARRDAGPPAGHGAQSPTPAGDRLVAALAAGERRRSRRRAARAGGRPRAPAARRPVRPRAGRRPRRPPGRGCAGSWSRCRPRAASRRSAR